METDLPWFRDLSADDQSWVGLIVQAGVKGFVDWYSHDSEPVPAGSALASAVFGAAPRALTGVINLQQTVDLVKLSLARLGRRPLWAVSIGMEIQSGRTALEGKLQSVTRLAAPLAERS